MEALTKAGIDLHIGRQLGELVKAEPFVDVREEEIKMPHGSWSQGILFELVYADEKVKTTEGLGN
jgi:hypothetical protein